MNTLKEKLYGTLGFVGYIIYYVLLCFITFLPLWVLDYSFWINLLLTAVILYIPYIGSLTQTVIYVLSFIKELERINSGNADIVTVLYFIAMAIHVTLFLLPYIIALFSTLYEAISDRRKQKSNLPEYVEEVPPDWDAIDWDAEAEK